MSTQMLKPSPKYVAKQRLSAGVGILALVAVFGLLFLILRLAQEVSTESALTILSVISAIGLVIWVLNAILIVPYYRSLRYEIQPEEVIVHAGIVTQSVKHVPYRTVTNIVIHRGIFDRLFALGTLKIQTAGMSGETGAEESLEGLENVQEIYDLVAAKLRPFRTPMAPTGTTEESAPVSTASTEAETLQAILAEVRSIRAQMKG